MTENPVTYHDIASGLVWPLLLRAPMMALAPTRLTLGMLAAIALSAWGSIATLILGPDDTRDAAAPDTLLTELTDAVLALRVDLLFTALARAAGSTYIWIRQSPLDALLVLAPALIIYAVAHHAIARSATIEHATGRHTDTVDALNDALRAVRQLALSTLGPLVPVAIVALLALVLGFTLGIPVLDLAGAVLYAVVLALSLPAVLVLWAHIVTLPISIAALASEGTDGFDAVQRALAYLAARPLRYALYAALAIASISICLTIAGALLTASQLFLENAAAATTNDAGRRLLASDGDLGATGPVALAIIGFWRTIWAFLLAAYAVSLIASCSSMMYLCLRRVCDGQDTTDVWDPED